MDAMVLCRCGHPSGLHSERGCLAGRHQPCPCRLGELGAIDAAVAAVRLPQRRLIAPTNPNRLHK
jgi:hypothetical protein